MRHPICPKCNLPMVFTFAFPGEEYACLPCGTTDEFFPRGFGRKLTEEEEADVEARKLLWQPELHRLAMGNGARCVLKSDGKPCDVCDAKDFKFVYWKSSFPAPQAEATK